MRDEQTEPKLSGPYLPDNADLLGDVLSVQSRRYFAGKQQIAVPAISVGRVIAYDRVLFGVKAQRRDCKS